jgi:hypothetical protein
MPYLRASGRFATVSRGGRTFVVRPPTVSTLLNVLELLPEELGAVIKAYRQEPAMASPAALPLTVSTIVRNAGARMVPVIETFVSCPESPIDAVRQVAPSDPAFMAQCLMAAISMADVAAIDRDTGLCNLDVDKAEAAAEDAEEVDADALSPIEKSILRVAKEFGQSPDAVMDWAWSSFMAAVKGIDYILSLSNSGAGASSAPEEAPYMSQGSAFLETIGVSYEDARAR